MRAVVNTNLLAAWMDTFVQRRHNQTYQLVDDTSGCRCTHCRKPTIAVQAGGVTVSVGGGQPGFTSGVLNTSLTVTHSGTLSTHFRCDK